ncbi:flagellar basal body rod protein FlgC [Ramlibacter sp. AW1]|uniref:Flagellar basal-body rod protein FlgC n=1 Tax=Ramlibacter aurantiacus TaxID=2801330 RepID=A0A936ZTG2_9BURK|nr:flagellar basal body rod protein FlgC [Ramlibacter aurantiacus]MBL0423325.1 flagellar basal body rod protein FlgC [Ramlibacter aurantiacus]
MSLFNVFSIAGSAVSAQSKRLNVVASNLANAEAVAGPDGKPFQARQVHFQSLPVEGGDLPGVRVAAVTESTALGKRVHDPRHPLADDQGYVTQSNVSVVDEMVNMISASRAYQNNVEVMNTARQLLSKTLQMGS